MLFDLNNSNIRNLLKKAEFGIERESLRVNSDGTLAQSKHPFVDDPHIDRDFCENQIEIIGDVFYCPDGINRQLNQILDEIDERISGNNELIWPFSNPPKISSEDEIPVAQFGGKLKSKSEYRYYLAEKYGKKKMLFSGIHLNYSFSNQLLKTAYLYGNYSDFDEFRNGVYLRLAKRLTQYSWLVVFLTAASPVADPSIGVESNVYSSIRCSEKGYWNDFTPILDYTDLNSYVKSIDKYIDSGNLRALSELYYPVRVKPRGENSLDALLQKGANHVELRVLDVNPLTRSGIFAEDIRFIQLLILYLSLLPDDEFDDNAQIKSVEDVKAAAVFGNADIKRRAKEALNEIKSFTVRYYPEYTPIVDYQLNKLHDGNSYAEIVSREYSKDYMNKGLALAKSYQRGERDV